jgi:hypothetical protein
MRPRSAAHSANMLDCLKSSGHDDLWVAEFVWKPARERSAWNLGHCLEINCRRTTT